MSLVEPIIRRTWRRVLMADRSLPAWVVEKLWRDSDALVRSGRMLKDGDRCTLVRLDTREGFVLKRYNLRGPLHTAGHWFLRSRAALNWNHSRHLAESGLATPRVSAMLEERFGPLRMRSLVLMEFVPGVPLLEAVKKGQLDSAKLEQVADQFATVWRTLGEQRIGHGDMKASNFIVGEDGRLWLIDLDGMHVRRSTALLARERRQDYERFMRNWEDRPEVAAVFRTRLDRP